MPMQPGAPRRYLALAIAAFIALTLGGCATANTPALAPTSAPPTPTSLPAATAIDNVWKSPGSVKLTALPLGDGHTSTTSPSIGNVYVCQSGNPNAGGSQVNGPWIHGSTWDETQKVVVQGKVGWPTASFSIKVEGSNRVITTNDLPVGFDTGTFPIQRNDPAYAYDRNPNSISTSQALNFSLPVNPSAAASPNCLTGGGIGVLLNGVLLFDALDGPGRDAVAHEEQDLCQGHPQQQGQYHYHEIPTCIRDNSPGESTVVGWADDGYPIVVERDAAGNLPNNADLDVCHGRTSPILLNGTIVTTYHYDATLEYPYTLGCFHGTDAVQNQGQQ
ncbi:MAG TPA: YHYH protein [Galbitalea sp.]|jgi:hypothetical protein|nr:YHYH protein [Galbitalea sp.]